MIDIDRYIRYFFSGYIFERNEVNKKLAEKNIFYATSKKYDCKVAVYTVCYGKYDEVKNPTVIEDEIDYYIFTDSELTEHSVWKKIDCYSEFSSSFERTRYMKVFPDLYFNDYDYTVYIDGNITIKKAIMPLVYSMIESGKKMAIHQHSLRNCIYDEARIVKIFKRANAKSVNKQMRKYRKEHFPANYGLFENNIIIRESGNVELQKIMKDWWNEITEYKSRDQLSLMYSLWKNGVDRNYVFSLGNNSRKSEYFEIVCHKK